MQLIPGTWYYSRRDTGAAVHLPWGTMRAMRTHPCGTAQSCRARTNIRFPGQNRSAAAHAAGHVAEAAQQEPSAVSLDFVRTQLIRQEDSIIFSLIERAQFLRNDNVYTPGGVPVPAYTPDGRCFTFLEYLLMDTEAVHGRIRRYTCPDEHAFFPDALPAMVRLPAMGRPGAVQGSRASCLVADGPERITAAWPSRCFLHKMALLCSLRDPNAST